LKYPFVSFSKKTLYPLLALSILVSTSCGNPPASQATNPLNTGNISDQMAAIEDRLDSLTDDTSDAQIASADQQKAAENLLQNDNASDDDKTPEPEPAPANAPVYSGPDNIAPTVKKFTLQSKAEPAFIRKHFEPSALCFDDNNNLYTVGDKGNYAVFSLKKASNGYETVESVKMNTMQVLKMRLKKKNKFDFEGLAFHNNLFYIADERDRKVITVDKQGNITDLKIDINGYLKANNIRNDVANSGLEGLTIDRKNNIMYLIKERQEPVIMVVDLNTNKITRHFKVNLPGKVEPALTDASFFEGSLYVLVRSHRLVLKLNPENGDILSEYDYRKNEEAAKNVYVKIPTFGSSSVDPDGYGVMEGLAVTKDSIYLATDNNELPLKSNLFNNYPQLFIFSRPE
jgi:hypothetical protein